MKARKAGLALCLALLLPALALAAPTLDQQQTQRDTSQQNTLGGGSEQKLAQVVTSGVAGLLTEVRVPLVCFDNTTLTIEIRDVSLTSGRTEPGRTVLASSTIPGSNFPSPAVREWDFRSVQLATPPFVPTGEQFAFVLSASGLCSVQPGVVGDPYPRGSGYFDARPNQSGTWVPLSLGTGRWDQAFQTVVDPICRAPNLVGLMRTAAEATILRYGCAIGSVRMMFSSSRAGVVVDQRPATETQLASGSPIDLVISQGERPCVVPNVVGRTLGQAKAALTRASCRLGRVTRAYSSRVARGRVVRQQPRAGSQLRPRAAVNLVFSRGAPS